MKSNTHQNKQQIHNAVQHVHTKQNNIIKYISSQFFTIHLVCTKTTFKNINIHTRMYKIFFIAYSDTPRMNVTISNFKIYKTYVVQFQTQSQLIYPSEHTFNFIHILSEQQMLTLAI